LAVYTGACGTLTELACNDDACGTQSSLQFTATAGTVYHILAGGYSGSTGTLTITATVTAPPAPSIRISPLTLTFGDTISPLSASSAAAGASAAPKAIVASSQKLVDPQQIMQGFSNSVTVKVIVNLAPPQATLAKTDFGSKDSLSTLQKEIKALQQNVLGNLPAGQVTLRLRYENIAAFSADVTLAGLEALMAHPQVVSIEPVVSVAMNLRQGIPLMHAMTYRSAFNGSNVAVAICDTGVDYNHVHLGGGGFPNAKVIGGYDFGMMDSDPYPDVSIGDENVAHGTCCAGIAAGDLGSFGDYIGGVAPGAKIYALKISNLTLHAPTDSIAGAWDWCVTHKNDDPNHPIVVASTSYGGDRYFSTCDSSIPTLATAANNCVAAGICIVVSSGNDGYCDSLQQPACLSSVISAGAVYDAAFGMALPCVNSASCAPKTASSGCPTGYYATDQSAADRVPSYVNMASFLTLLAPGDDAYTLDITGALGYSSGDYFATFGGTSAAAPYAAGAVAALQSAAKALTGSFLTPASVKSRLTSTGDNVTDPKVAITRPRINLDRAIQGLGAQSFRIYNDGNAPLNVGPMTFQSPAPWVSFGPVPPITIATNGYQDILVGVDMSKAPIGESSVRLLVGSNDSTKNPYPGGVYIVTFNGTPLTLSGISVSNQVVHFTVSGPPFSNCIVFASSVLTNWQPVLTNPIPGSGSFSFTDATATNQAQRFYRAKVP
jgi:subtilisin family serine protease